MKKIALLNVKYSPNLGDGIIAECLEREIVRLIPRAQVVSIDLAGRKEFGAGLDKRRGAVLGILDALPRTLRGWTSSLAIQALIRFRYRKNWQSSLDRADYVILGGGQLVADTDLNFPLKISAAMREVRKRDLPLAIFGVGVSEHISGRGEAMLKYAFAQPLLTHVATRDEGSQANWNSRFKEATKMKADLCFDPGLLCCDLYPELQPCGNGSTPTIGLGITHPRTLALHSSETLSHPPEDAEAFWISLCRKLRALGLGVEMFTTGPADDTSFLQSIYQKTRDLGVKQAPRPKRPIDLAASIARYDAVAAHRLHANIIAYSFQIPNVALRWDRKVDAFMASVSRERFVMDATEATAAKAERAIQRTLADGIDHARHGQVLSAARASVRDCIVALTSGSFEAAASHPSEIKNSLRPRPAAG